MNQKTSVYRGPLLEVQGLSASHGQLVAVRNISFSLKRGDAVALIGANGAGKTTLLRCLAGVHPATLGHVRLDGENVTAWPAYQRVHRGMALVPEGRRLFGDMTVRENLRVAEEHCGPLSGGRIRWNLERVLHALPMLAGLLERPAGALSGGQRQAAAIARALMTNPEMLILDEVSLGLSPLVVEEVYANLRQLRRDAGMTLLLVEQDLTRALDFADRVLCMREGHIVLEARCDDVTREQVTAAYFGVTSGQTPNTTSHSATKETIHD